MSDNTDRIIAPDGATFGVAIDFSTLPFAIVLALAHWLLPI